MRRKQLIAAAIAVVLLGVLGYFLYHRGHGKGGGNGGDDPVAAALRAHRGQRGSHTDTRPASAAGHVRDRAGQPIAGATISIAMRNLSRGERSAPGEAPEPIITASAADGSWKVADLAPGRYTVSAAARRHLPATVDPLLLAPAEERSDVDLVLGDGGTTLRGTISDIGGGPIDGALVRATSIGEGNLFHFFRAPFTAVSDGQGKYELSLAPGAYLLEVFHVDYVGDQRWTEIRGGERVEDFRLTPGAVVYGQVKSRATDEPVAGATVTWQGARGGNRGLDLPGFGLSSTTSDAQGKFVLRGLRAGTVALRAFGPGFASSQPTEVDLGIGEEATEVVIYVDRAWTISGYVVDKSDHDHGIDGVLVGAFNFGGDVRIARDSTAEDGWFEIHGVQNGNYFIGAAGEDRVVSLMGKNVQVDNADVTDVILELDAGATLTGRVDPPAPAHVAIQMDSESIGLGNVTQAIAAAAVNGRTADDGTFTLHGVPNGKFTLVARADDGADGKLAIDVNGDLSGLVVKLEPRARISGVVVDEGGNPVQGVRVEASARSGDDRPMWGMAAIWDQARGVTAADGSFEVVGLRAGVHEVSVSDDKGRLAWASPADPKEPDKPIEVTIEGTQPVTGLRLAVENRDQVIRGLVIGPDGGALADAWVTARRREADPLARFRRGRDRARSRDNGDDKQAGDGDDEGDSRTVTVTVGSDGSSVESDKGGKESEEKANQRRRMRQFTPAEAPVLTGADGRFEIRGLRDGSYDLEAEGLKGAARGELENVKTGADVTIKLATLAGITGKVTYLGKPVNDYTIEATGPESRRTHVVAADGVYHINRVDPGSYQLSVIAPDGRAGGEVKVTANQTATRDLQLVAYGSVRGVLLDATRGEPMDGVPVLAFSEQGSDVAGQAMSMMTGQGPKTDAQGRFRVGRLGAGKGTFVAVDGDAGGFEIIAQKEFELTAGQDLDLGEIRGQSVINVPKDKRGDLGMTVMSATFAGRPRADGDDATEPPAGLDAETEYLWVSSVEIDGPAAAAGVAVGDRVVAVSGVDVALVGPRVIEAMLSPRRLEAGKPVALVLERDGRRNTVNVVARPATP